VTVTLDRHETPDYIVRNLWYNWGTRPGAELDDWSKKNRMGSSFGLKNGHNHFRIRNWARKEFKEHPEYTALVKGKRKSNKFCLSNVDVRKICVDYAIDYFKKNPDEDSISMESGDGGGECQCEPCAKLGSPSDRILLLANEVARVINGMGIGEKYVGILAYNYHCAPPEKVEADPHVIVSCTKGYTRGGWGFHRICEGWSAKGATMGSYSYYNVVVRDWCMPGRNRPAENAGKLRREFEDYGIRFATIEAGESWGPYGPGYYVSSRALWDTSIGSPHPWGDPRVDDSRVMPIVEEFLHNCFGPAYEPMKTFYYDMVVHQFAYNSRMPGFYQSLAEARRMAAGHPDVIARIDDLIKYLHYVTLKKHGAKQEVLKWTYRIRDTKMIHSLGIFSRMHKTTYGFKGREGPLYDQTPISEAELLKVLQEDLALHLKLDKDAVRLHEKTYSTQLAPIRQQLKKDEPHAQGNLPKNGVDSGSKRMLVHVTGSPAVLNFKATVTKAETQGDLSFALHRNDPAGEIVAQEMRAKGSTQKDEVLTVSMQAPEPGLYCLAADMGNGRIDLEFPADQSFVLAVPPYLGEHTYKQHFMFHGKWNLYFYVPKGTKVVSIRGSKIWSFMGPISGTLVDGDGNQRVDFRTIRQGGNLNVDVPDGQDGQFWMFKDSVGLRHLMNVPPYLSDSPQNLLLPQEVIQKDFVELTE